MPISTIGLVAAFCTTIAFMPQTIKILKTRKTKDLSLPMYMILTTGITLWFIYGLLLNDLAIMLANGVTFLQVTVILFLKIKNG